MSNTMPARAPTLRIASVVLLKALGARIRVHRKAMRISAVTTAEAAGMSRVTLHRIERGEPSVSIGAYVNALTALGLSLDVQDTVTRLDRPIALASYPQLAGLTWSTPHATELLPEEAIALYERNWRHVDPSTLEEAERRLIRHLCRTFGVGPLLV